MLYTGHMEETKLSKKLEFPEFHKTLKSQDAIFEKKQEVYCFGLRRLIQAHFGHLLGLLKDEFPWQMYSTKLESCILDM